jgi:hypothetical protein
MNGRHHISLLAPDYMERKGTRCFCLGDNVVYEQIDGSKQGFGNKWNRVNRVQGINGQLLVDLLFKDSRNIPVDFSGSDLGDNGGGMSANKIMAYSEL